MLSDPSTLVPGTLLAGRFRVVRCLGTGGMGAVYEIEHELTKHRRALKLLHAAMAASASIVERFLREASAAGRVGNPHIAETFDAGTLESGEPYLVMEILRGETLAERLTRGRLSVSEMVDLIGQACEGVQAAHDAGIVHRDLKPDNLFIIDVDGRPFVKILDFGISKFDPQVTGDLALTQEGAALGTPYYMPPEQIRGEKNLDARADVYALGVILYECAAGVRPFEAESLPQLAVLIHTGEVRPLGEYRPELPQGFVELVARAMAINREQRLQTAEGLALALERYGSIAFRGVSGLPPSMLHKHPSLLPQAAAPQNTAPARSLVTSAAGVSVRALQVEPAPGVRAGRRRLFGLAIGAGVLAIVAGSVALLFRPAAGSGPDTSLVADGSGARSLQGSNAPAVPPSGVATGNPAAAAAMAPAAAVGPGLSASKSAPSSSALPSASAASAEPSVRPGVVGHAAPAGVTGGAQPTRSQKTGLARDNPFR
jgi:eukaryotic-like serine/threonine-protein kinase